MPLILKKELNLSV